MNTATNVYVYERLKKKKKRKGNLHQHVHSPKNRNKIFILRPWMECAQIVICMWRTWSWSWTSFTFPRGLKICNVREKLWFYPLFPRSRSTAAWTFPDVARSALMFSCVSKKPISCSCDSCAAYSSSGGTTWMSKVYRSRLRTLRRKSVTTCSGEMRKGESGHH